VPLFAFDDTAIDYSDLRQDYFRQENAPARTEAFKITSGVLELELDR